MWPVCRRDAAGPARRDGQRVAHRRRDGSQPRAAVAHPCVTLSGADSVPVACPAPVARPRLTRAGARCSAAGATAAAPVPFT